MRRITALACAAAMFVLGVQVRTEAAPPKLVGTLETGSSVFWTGGKIGGYADRLGGLPSTLSASCLEAGQCYSYDLKVAGKGERLRVGIDVPERRDMFKLSAVDPHGTATTVENLNAFNAELFVDKPAMGMWKVVVAPMTAQRSTFKLRAKLEKTAYEPSRAKKLWMPNLMVPRLWEFGFVAPVTGLAGFSFDDANPPLSAAGINPYSCTLDEMIEGAQRCLRFSFQLANAGDGVFDVRFDTSGDPTFGKMIQCVQRPNGSVVAHDAGEFDFHAIHGHYHYRDVVQHRLYEVTNRTTGQMRLAGLGKKVGYHPADQSFAEWDEFVQAPSGTSADAGNCYPESNNQIGLSTGWGDAYRWQRPGNYVEFGDNGNGWYVVRTVADPTHHVMETNEDDNTGYAYIRVLGDSVRLIEQGQGDSPWDPHKVVSRY